MRGKGVILVLISAIAFGTMATVAHHAHVSGLDVGTLMLLRFGIAAAVVAAIARVRREAWPRGRTLAWLVLMGAGLYFGQSLAFSALRSIPAATASLLLYLYPVFVTLLSVAFFGERLTWSKAGALGLALVGTALTIGPVAGGDRLGVALAIGSAVLYALYIVVGSRHGDPAAPMARTATVMIAGTASYAVLASVQGLAPITPAAFGWAALLALISVVAIGAFLIGLATISPVDASILSALEPIVTAIMAVVFLGQPLTPFQIAGGAIVLAAVMILVLSQRSRDRLEPS
jgi:drug/metabolite transporter (DMT)-like permease